MKTITVTVEADPDEDLENIAIRIVGTPAPEALTESERFFRAALLFAVAHGIEACFRKKGRGRQAGGTRAAADGDEAAMPPATTPEGTK